MIDKNLFESALIALRDCMKIGPEETLLVLTDDATAPIGAALFEQGKTLAKDIALVIMPERDVNGAEPPTALASLMQQYDAVICPTHKSLTHTNARRNACDAGARVATMPGITEEVMIRTMKADYGRIAERTRKLSAILDRTDLVRVTTPMGTDIHLPISGIRAISSTGLVTEKGGFGNLPSGESFLMPQEQKSSGVFVVDGSFAGVGRIGDRPIRITVENGYAVQIEGGEEAQRLNDMLEPFGRKGRNIAELGIGTNDQAIITGQILEDEKVMGTVHIALGNNLSMGGTCDVGIHVDGVFTRPTVYADDRVLMKDGKLLLD